MTRVELSRLVMGALLFLAGLAVGWVARGISDPAALGAAAHGSPATGASVDAGPPRE